MVHREVFKRLEKREWRKGNPSTLMWESKLVQPQWRTVWRFLTKLKIELPYDPAIPLLSIYPMKTKIQTDTCNSMFLKKEVATHSSILAWRNPWTEEPGRLWSVGHKSWT